MLASLFDSSTISVLEQVVNFTEARHGVLAGNVANLDTPGYRTRDLSPELFQERLQEAIETRHASPRPTYGYGSNNSTKSAGAAQNLDPFQGVKESMKSILYHDDSDVSIEQQVTEIMKNQSQHNLAITLMASQFRLLRAAVSERVA